MTQHTTEMPTRRWWLWGCSGDVTPNDARNLRVVNLWTLGWMVTYLVSLLVMETYGDNSAGIATTAMVAAALPWIAVVWAFSRFLRSADELTRMIQLQAMAVGFAAGVFMALMMRFFERVVSFMPVNPIASELLGFMGPLMAMIFGYMIAVIRAQRKYSR